MRNNNKTKTTFPASPFITGSTLLLNPLPFTPCPSGAGGWEIGHAVSSLLFVSASPSFSHSSPAPAWGPTHGKQSFMDFSVGILQKLLQRGSFPWGAVLHKQIASVSVPLFSPPAPLSPPGSQVLQKPPLAWAFLRLQLLSGPCSCVDFPQSETSFRACPPAPL